MRFLGPPRERPGFAAAADALLRGEQAELPEQRVDFLRWLGAHRPVVFHGSPRGDLDELSTERRSRDSTTWGDQTAVYASDDPIWALYFAVLRRDNGWTGTMNGAVGIGNWRCYFFLHNEGSESPERFGPGSLYLLPPETFDAQPRVLGVLDLHHLVSRVPVKPLARIDVTPADFPFRDSVGYFRAGEPIWRSLLRA